MTNMDCLHDYKTIYQSHEAVVEVCNKCHKKTPFKFDPRGKYDTRTYNQEHRRDFLQKDSKEYQKEYGNRLDATKFTEDRV